MTTSIAIQRLVEVCRRQHKALSTERTYALWLKYYCRFISGLEPSLASERKLEAFLTMLARQRNVSASTQNQAFNAILFFYKDVLRQPDDYISTLDPGETWKFDATSLNKAGSYSLEKVACSDGRLD